MFEGLNHPYMDDDDQPKCKRVMVAHALGSNTIRL